ncbi:MAG: fumarylacetoacetate hydrolase family protein [Pirellulales bacterium]|nr:fumarylacetoacetate hydrolase family protein [Pirellulales bacterium]
MKLVKFQTSAGIKTGLWENDAIVPLRLEPGTPFATLADILEADDPAAAVHELVDRRATPYTTAEIDLLAPIDRQEVWAAGVTYLRSRAARMEESEGAARFYDLVYEAPRPELFFKANPHRVVDPGGAVRIRRDAAWNVPEPELTLVLNSRMKLVGFTIGNDMSSRDIEGENPLYLPQAKVYDGSCALGPAILLADDLPKQTEIKLTVRRQREVAFTDTTNLGQMARTFDDLIGWLARDNSFPEGAFLLTGTGIVPKDDFTLLPQDEIEITIEPIGTLANTVVQG